MKKPGIPTNWPKIVTVPVELMRGAAIAVRDGADEEVKKEAVIVLDKKSYFFTDNPTNRAAAALAKFTKDMPIELAFSIFTRSLYIGQLVEAFPDLAFEKGEMTYLSPELLEVAATAKFKEKGGFDLADAARILTEISRRTVH